MTAEDCRHEPALSLLIRKPPGIHATKIMRMRGPTDLAVSLHERPELKFFWRFPDGIGVKRPRRVQFRCVKVATADESFPGKPLACQYGLRLNLAERPCLEVDYCQRFLHM